jgi:hypothetical protein
MLWDQNDDRLALEIVAKRQDRYNRLVEPWVYQQGKSSRVAFPRLERIRTDTPQRDIRIMQMSKIK